MIEYNVRIHDSGTEEWLFNGNRHRENGPAMRFASGTERYYLDGKLHRVDGPAIIRPNGDGMWYLNGERHRVCGPAIELSDGYKAWFLNDEMVTQEEHERRTGTKQNAESVLRKIIRYIWG